VIQFRFRLISIAENTFFKVVYVFFLYLVRANLMDLQYGRAMAQVFCRRVLTAQAEAACGIYGGQSGTGTGFSMRTHSFAECHSTSASHSFMYHQHRIILAVDGVFK
jgi:hypothetical protein